MNKRRLPALIILISLVAIIGGLCAVYFFVLDSFLFIMDSSWTQVTTLDQTLSFAKELLLKERLRLKVVELDQNAALSSFMIQLTIQTESPKVALLSPVITAVLEEQRFDVASVFPSTVVMGMGSKGHNYVDVLLVSDDISGWKIASKEILNETKTSARNFALVYSSTVKDVAQAIVDEAGAKNVTQYEKSSASSLFYKNTIADMDKLGLTIVLCPYVEDFYDFFQSPNTLSWVVDYRFAPAVPKKNLLGRVRPAMNEIVRIMDSAVKGSHEKVSLPYEFSK